MRRLVIPLLAAYSASFVALGISYIYCSKLLTPAEFGAYTMALAVGAFAVLVLDGGIKVSIIKRQFDLTRDEQGGLLLALMAFAGFLLAILAVLFLVRNKPWVDAPWGDELVVAFAAIYIVSYPWIGISTALLERRLEYSKIARVEALSMIVERLSPLAILTVFKLGLMSFAIGLVAGRVTRLVLLVSLAPVAPLVREFSNTRRMFAEGLWTQVGSGAAAVRDNLHVIIIGPFFGAAWVGYYGWALQLSTLASQAFAQVAARIALPLAAQTLTWEQRWDTILAQVRILAAATAPLLAATLLLAPWIDQWYFAGKWLESLPILALLCARMVPGVATSPLGPLLIVERGTRHYALANVVWSGAEFAAGAGAAYCLGRRGLAYSWAVTAWVGMAALIWVLRQDFVHRFLQVCTAVLNTPAVGISVAWAVAGIGWVGVGRLGTNPMLSSVASICVVVSCVALDRRLRSALVGRTM